jgi:glyoxylase-like metal-dependent hydrolase (beta-lactamase superfamily II)
MRWSIWAVRTAELSPPTEAQTSLGAVPLVTWLLRSGKTTFLVDCGPDDETVQAHCRSAFAWRLRVEEALQALGRTAADVSGVLLTHLHWDHAGAVHYWADTPLYAHPAEVAFARDRSHAQARAYPLLRGQLRPLRDGDEVAPGVRAVELPGHTPGSLGFAVDTAQGEYVIAGDLVSFRAQMTSDPWGQPGVAWDAADCARSLARLRAQSDETRVLPSHEPSLFETGDLVHVATSEGPAVSPIR